MSQVASPASVPLLAVSGLDKAFPGTQALAGVDLALAGGEVHALVGQNGSGKSTLIKILSGYHTPDHGALEVRGRRVPLPVDPRTAHAEGIRFVHQNPGFSPRFTVLETIRLQSFETTWYGRIAWARERKIVQALLAEVDLRVDPDLPIAELTPSERALVAIIRALQDMRDRPGILVLDEPTASLTRREVDQLFAAIDRMRSAGHAILFVSHRLDEVLAMADRITVLRDGQIVRSVRPSETDEADLITAILGHELAAFSRQPHMGSSEAQPASPALELSGLTGATVRGFDCSIREGEIVGVTGLGGMGHDEIPYLAFGAIRPWGGTITVGGQAIAHPSPAAAIQAGMAFLPADRERDAGVGRATVAENVTIGRLREYFARGWLRADHERKDVGALLRHFEIRPDDPDRLLLTLSGGNQQRALLAKWLYRPPRVLLLHEPTQGVDVGSRQQVLRSIRGAADAGTATLIASSEYSDLARLCDRVLVMRGGRVAKILTGSAIDEDRLVAACYASA